MSGRTLNDLIADALRASLTDAATTLPVLPTDGGGGLLPGVNLDDNSALLDLMDGLELPEPR